MKLLYTLRYGAYAGNCGGDLRLFFTTQNASDWKSTPSPGLWLLPANAPETLTLPTGDAIEFSLYVVNNGMPGLLYLYGAILVTPKGGTAFGPPMGQAAPVLFAPGKPELAILSGHNKGATGGVSWDIGFDLAVPWDGTSADCTGHWWAIW